MGWKAAYLAIHSEVILIMFAGHWQGLSRSLKSRRENTTRSFDQPDASKNRIESESPMLFFVLFVNSHTTAILVL